MAALGFLWSLPPPRWLERTEAASAFRLKRSDRSETAVSSFSWVLDRRPKNRGPFQRVPVIRTAISERLAKLFPS
jgi:hypothetical protein